MAEDDGSTKITISSREVVPSKETLTTEVVAIDLAKLQEIESRTRQAALTDDHEFGVFLLGKEGIINKIVEFGIGHSKGVVGDEELAINTLRRYIDEGFEVIADYHPHPVGSGYQYVAKGLPREFALSPSTGDMNAAFFRRCEKLGLDRPYVRIIGTYLPDKDMVVFNPFRVNKPAPYKIDLQPFEFQAPVFVVPQEDAIVKRLPPVYTDPRLLIQLGYITPINLFIQSGAETNIRQNDLLDLINKE